MTMICNIFIPLQKKVSHRNKTLSNFDDLAAISDFDLLEINRRIGIINDVNYKRLENVNYLRNHASAFTLMKMMWVAMKLLPY